MNTNIKKETIEYVTRKLIETPSPVGYYEQIQPVFEELAHQYGYEVSYDRKRTAYIKVEGNDTSKTICVGAHLDTIGLMVRHICDNGTLELRNLGGVNYNNCEGCSVHIHTRGDRFYTGLLVCKAHSTHVFDEARSDVREEANMMVILDEPVTTAQQVRDLGIEHGDIISIDPDYHYTEKGYIKSRFIDDKAAVGAVFAVLELMKQQQIKPAYTTLFAFPLYEEIGHGGAYLPPEVEEYVALDIGLIGPDHTGSEYKVSICAKDNYTPYDRELTSKLIHLAKQNEIAYSVDVFYHYGTDASAAIRAGNNVYAAAFGMGCFASHGMERCHIDAVVETSNLLLAYILSK
ncbi:MAG: M42 family metallopeptidase [Longicatena sp.]